jgi:hypothetical protein
MQRPPEFVAGLGILRAKLGRLPPGTRAAEDEHEILAEDVRQYRHESSRRQSHG